jgi:hypothetical protein
MPRNKMGRSEFATVTQLASRRRWTVCISMSVNGQMFSLYLRINPLRPSLPSATLITLIEA